MSLISNIVDPLLSFHGWPAYAVVGGLALAEAALFVGFVLPGETAVILGGVLAFRDSVSLPVMLTVVILCAIVGDSIGYEVGKKYGERILGMRIFAKHQAAIESGKERLHRLGGRAVFLGRFTAFLRAVMPGMAGTVRLPYRRFLPWNAAGAVIWGGGFTMLGYLAGASYTKLESYASIFSWVVLGVVVLLVVIFVLRRRRRTTSDAAAEAVRTGAGEKEPAASQGRAGRQSHAVTVDGTGGGTWDGSADGSAHDGRSPGAHRAGRNVTPGSVDEADPVIGAERAPGTD